MLSLQYWGKGISLGDTHFKMLFYKCYPQIDELLVKYAYKSFDLYVTQFVSYGVEKEVAEKMAEIADRISM
jgi:hypothetical protein